MTTIIAHIAEGGLMMKPISKDEIINTLITYLPKMASSLQKIVNYLNDMIDKNDEFTTQDTKKDSLDPAINELKNLIDNLKILMSTMNKIETEVEIQENISSLYLKSIKNIISGTENLLLWIEDETQQDNLLIESIDLLFNAGQQIIKLVNILTEE